jgi:ribosomal protein L17
LKAHHLAAELDKAAHNLFFEGPTYIASRRARLLSSSSSSSSSRYSLASLPSSLEEAYRLQYENEMKKKQRRYFEQLISYAVVDPLANKRLSLAIDFHREKYQLIRLHAPLPGSHQRKRAAGKTQDRRT